MLKIKMERSSTGDKDWRVAQGEYYFPKRWLLCDDRAQGWWETDGFTKGTLTISSTPNASAYRAQLVENGAMKVQDEQSMKWHVYGLFAALYSNIEDHVGYKRFYLGMEDLS